MAFDARFFDDRGELRVEYLRDRFVVGRDDQLIRLMARYGRFNFPNMPTVEDVTINDVVQLGFFTRSHIIDCSADDPMNFRFDLHSRLAHVERGGDFEGRRVREAHWAALRDFGAHEFSRVKTAATPDFSFVDYVMDGLHVSYRRLIMPLSSNGSEVSQLLVAFVHDQTAVAGGAGD